MNIYFTEVTIPSTSELVGQSVRNSRLQRRFDVDVLELQRNGKVILPPLADSCLLYTSPSPRDPKTSRMPSSA